MYMGEPAAGGIILEWIEELHETMIRRKEASSHKQQRLI